MGVSQLFAQADLELKVLLISAFKIVRIKTGMSHWGLAPQSALNTAVSVTM
jgi:hypothetical protein